MSLCSHTPNRKSWAFYMMGSSNGFLKSSSRRSSRIFGIFLLLSFQFSCMEAKKFSLDASNPAGLFLQIAIPNVIAGANGNNASGSSFTATGDIHSVKLSWPAVTDGSKFKIYSSNSSSVTATGSPEITGSGTGIAANNFTHSGLTGGETRYYLLEKIQTDGTKSYSQIVQATTYYLPTDVSSLVLWLNAETGVAKDGANKITTWQDQVNANVFTRYYANQEPYWLPAYRNQRPFVQMSNGEGRFFSGSGVPITGSSYTMLFVIEQNATSVATEGIIHLSGGGVTLYLKFYNGQLLINSGGGDFQSNAYATNSAHILTMQFSGTGTSLYLNGSLQKNTTNVYNAVGNNLTYLGVYAGGSGFDGRLAETLIYNQGLSAADRVKAECYLAFKYNLTVPHTCN
ncbi:hypothetical protein EHQ83_11925 [Leptospira yasudae]|uniref:Uncharacterized protein n=2 Tax=Leptospira yasudae TaxID=2202201 RepID=A0A6N4QKB0_9LEPT|nr:hypothetical protein EHQ77_18460 [Leptospira yasudae]TGL83303.1 hypothetical protein EHQ72_02375 [Leptospira yasudae]TGL83781.1 hypothetical protein EHQ83_11925 [Leptospira yasudae]